MKAVLITGASGFVGENLARRLRDVGRLYLVYGSRRPRAPAEVTFSVDLSVRGNFSRKVGDLEVEAVVHAAALVSPDQCERDPDAARTINVEGTAEVARWARDRGAKMIYFSTDLVFDGERGGYGEEDEPRPLNVYGRTKLEGEEAVMRTCSRWAILRLALSYGPTRGAKGDWTRAMRETVRQGGVLRLFTDQFRSPAYVEDTAEAVFRLVHSDRHGLYHMGGGERVSRYAFGRTFARLFGIPEDRITAVRMADVPLAAPRARDCSLDTTRLRRELGLVPCGIEDGLRRQKAAEEGLETAG